MANKVIRKLVIDSVKLDKHRADKVISDKAKEDAEKEAKKQEYKDSDNIDLWRKAMLKIMLNEINNIRKELKLVKIDMSTLRTNINAEIDKEVI